MVKSMTRALLAAPLGLLALSASPALAQDAAAPAPAEAPSPNAMVNLVRLLVQQGVLKAEAGDALIAQAEAEAAQAQRLASGALPPPQAGAIRVPYIPETVRQQIKDELRSEVLAEAREKGYAAPDQAAPDWVRMVKIGGDIRFRSETALFSDANIVDYYIDYGALNQGGPFDAALERQSLPFLNTTEDQINQLKLRARLNVTADISPALQVGFQLATGSSRSPISTNETLGGGFEKRDLWLQKAYARVRPVEPATLWFGRFDNPFTSTDLLYDADLAFDGVAADIDLGKLIGGGFALALRGGAFPLDFGGDNYPDLEIIKDRFPEKYLFSAQVEAGFPIMDRGEVKLAVAYHSFDNVQGELSSPCIVGEDFSCSTDGLVLLNPTKGNTVRFLRLNDDPNLTGEDPQLIGLAFDYDILDIVASAKFPVDDAVSVTVVGNYVRNLGFDRDDLCREFAGTGAGGPINNTDVVLATDNFCQGGFGFLGGNQGWQGKVRFGHDNADRLGRWWVEGGYRYLETDAVLDSFTDSNFALGGTGHEGWFLGGKTGLLPGSSLGVTWRSTDAISGLPQLSVDVLQVDLEAAF